MFDKAKLKNELHRYVDAGIYKSVSRNAYMNDLADDFSDSKAQNFLENFLERKKFNELNEDKVSDGLRKLVAEAKDARRSMYMKLPQSVVDAVLVDYINFVAYSYGIDYALYTKDLR